MKKYDLVECYAIDLAKQFTFVEGIIYKVANKDYEYVTSAVTGDFSCGDAYPCDEKGNHLAGYESSIPILETDLEYVVWEDDSDLDNSNF